MALLLDSSLNSKYPGQILGKKEVKFTQRKKRILGTLSLFILLNFVPVILEQLPKWKTQNFSRKFAQEINTLKRQACIHQQVYRLKILPGPGLFYQIEQLPSNLLDSPQIIKKVQLDPSCHFQWLLPKMTSSLELPVMQEEFYYDYLKKTSSHEKVKKFGIIAIQDLWTQRLDRISMVWISGDESIVQFE